MVLRSWLMAVASLLMIVLAGCGGGGSKAKATPTPAPTASAPATPEYALAQYVQTTFQKPFVADCSKLDQAKDQNKYCATFKADRQSLKAYVIGPTFQAPTQWVILQNQGSQWKVVSTQSITPDNSSVPGIPWPLETGVDVVVTGADPCLNVREGPGLNQKAVDCIKNGSTIQLSAGPTNGDGIQWWQVKGRTGWVAGDFLRYPDATH